MTLCAVLWKSPNCASQIGSSFGFAQDMPISNPGGQCWARGFRRGELTKHRSLAQTAYSPSAELPFTPDKTHCWLAPTCPYSYR